jgi:hypothetical protein
MRCAHPPVARSLTLALTRCVALSFTLAACGGDTKSAADSSGGDAESCGDIDGEGGDTGDVPNILGAWTTSYGTNRFDDGVCSIPGLSSDEISDVMAGVLKIEGRVPDAVYATLNNGDDRFYGLVNSQGGVVFTGSVEKAGHTLYVSFGGLLYRQPQTDRDELRGFSYIGVDLDGADSVIDCWVQGDWRATRSGN